VRIETLQPLFVIPAKAGIHTPWTPAPHLRGDKLRGGDEWGVDARESGFRFEYLCVNNASSISIFAG